jgi:hypothetical protein
VTAANANDPALFPNIIDNPELRARAIAKSVSEFKKIPVSDEKLKKSIDERLSKFDGHRTLGQAASKKSKLDAKKLNEPASEATEFRKLVPYQDLSHPTQRADPPGNPPKNSLLSVYWKMRSSIIEEPRLCGRKYWE